MYFGIYKENNNSKETIEENDPKGAVIIDRLNKELLLTFQKSERLEFGWTGNLGQWFWDFTTNEVTFNPLKAEAIGYMKEDLPEKVSYEFFTDTVHPDDKDEVMQLMTNHLKGKMPVWEVKYRIQDRYVAGRYRDSVFLIILENTENEVAGILAEIIKQTVLETVFEVSKHVSVSAGVSTYYPDETISELIQKSAQKLVATQKNGGDQVVL